MTLCAHARGPQWIPNAYLAYLRLLLLYLSYMAQRSNQLIHDVYLGSNLGTLALLQSINPKKKWKSENLWSTVMQIK